MSLESARQFLADAREDRELRMEVQLYLLTRDDSIIEVGEFLDYDFTHSEIQQAIETDWNVNAPLDTLGEESFVSRTVDSDAAITFFRNPKNRAYVQGRRRTPVLEKKGFTFWHGVLTAGVLGFCALISAIHYRITFDENETLRRNTIQAEAVVVERRTLACTLSCCSDGEISDYYLTYRYPYPELTHTLEQEVDKGTYEALDYQDHVNIRYNPSNPSELVLEDTLTDDYQYPTTPLMCFVAFVVVSGLFLWGHVYNQLRLRRGTLVQGTMTMVWGSPDWNRPAKFCLLFRSPLDQRRIAAPFFYPLGRDDLPPLGSHGTVAILFVDEWHWWLL